MKNTILDDGFNPLPNLIIFAVVGGAGAGLFLGLGCASLGNKSSSGQFFLFAAISGAMAISLTVYIITISRKIWPYVKGIPS